MNILESEWLLIHLVLGLLSAWGVYPYIYISFLSSFLVVRISESPAKLDGEGILPMVPEVPVGPVAQYGQ